MFLFLLGSLVYYLANYLSSPSFFGINTAMELFCHDSQGFSLLQGRNVSHAASHVDVEKLLCTSQMEPCEELCQHVAG